MMMSMVMVMVMVMMMVMMMVMIKMMMSSSDALRSVRRVPAQRRGGAAFDTDKSAAVAARAKRERGGQQPYVVAMACWRSEYLRGESVPLEHACCMRGCWSVRAMHADTSACVLRARLLERAMTLECALRALRLAPDSCRCAVREAAAAGMLRNVSACACAAATGCGEAALL
jgi:hypothetical protein